MLKHNKTNANENLSEMMKKSVKNELDDDGITTLNYQVWFFFHLIPSLDTQSCI